MGAFVPAQAQKKPMNIVFIMSDDHSYQTISAYDNVLSTHQTSTGWLIMV